MRAARANYTRGALRKQPVLSLSAEEKQRVPSPPPPATGPASQKLQSTVASQPPRLDALTTPLTLYSPAQHGHGYSSTTTATYDRALSWFLQPLRPRRQLSVLMLKKPPVFAFPLIGALDSRGDQNYATGSPRKPFVSLRHQFHLP